MRSISSILFGTALLVAGNGLLGTSLGIRLASEQSLGAAGVVVSAFSVGLGLGAWRASRVLERVGHIRAFAAFSAVVAAATLGILVVDSVPVWVLFRIAQGFAMAGNYLVVESWLSHRAGVGNRARVLAIYVITCQVALAVGQLLVTVQPPDGGTPVLLAALLYVLALVPVALTRTPQPAVVEPARAGLGGVLRKAPVAVAGCFVAGGTAGTLINLGAPFATALGLSSSQVAAFMASGVLGGLVLQVPIGHLADRMDRRLVIELIALCTVAVSALFLVRTEHLGYVVGTAFLLGAFAFVMYPVSVAHAHDLVAPDDMIAASGTMVLAYAAGSSAIPLLGSLALEVYGAQALPPVLMVMNLGLGAWAVLRIARRRRLPVHEPAPVPPLAMPMVAPGAELEQDRPSGEPGSEGQSDPTLNARHSRPASA